MNDLTNELVCRIVEAAGWQPRLIASLARVSRRFAHLAQSEFWRGFCLSRERDFAIAFQSQAVQNPNLEEEVRQTTFTIPIAHRWSTLAKLVAVCPAAKHPPMWLLAYQIHHLEGGNRGPVRFLSLREMVPDNGDEIYIISSEYSCKHLVPYGGLCAVFRGIILNFRQSRYLKWLKDNERRDLLEEQARSERETAGISSSHVEKDSCAICGSYVYNRYPDLPLPEQVRKWICASGGEDADVKSQICEQGHFYGVYRLITSDGDDSSDDTETSDSEVEDLEEEGSDSLTEYDDSDEDYSDDE